MTLSVLDHEWKKEGLTLDVWLLYSSRGYLVFKVWVPTCILFKKSLDDPIRDTVKRIPTLDNY